MDCSMASQNLAIASYKIATDPNYTEDLARQIEAGKLDGGELLSEDEKAALELLVAQMKPAADGPAPSSSAILTWIG